MEELLAFFKWMFGGVGKIIGIILLVACALWALEYLIALVALLFVCLGIYNIYHPEFGETSDDLLLSDEELAKKRKKNLSFCYIFSWLCMLVFEVSVMSIFLDKNINIVPEAYDGDNFAFLIMVIAAVFNAIVMVFIRLFQKD